MSVCSAVSLKIYKKEQGHDTMGCMNIIMVVLIVGIGMKHAVLIL